MSLLLLIQLLVAHVLGDFALQPTSWVQHRAAHHFRSRYLYWHVLVHLALALTVTARFGCWWIAPVIATGHLVFDGFKAYWKRTDFTAFIIDQLLHLGVILFCCAALFVADWRFSISHVLSTEKFWWYGLGYLLVVFAYPRFIQFATKEWRKHIPAEREMLLSAGRWIGIIERVLILTFVLINQFAAIGFLLAAKSIFRFGDLKEARDKGHTEYVMIGTLLSFGLTIITGLIIVYCTQNPR